MSTDADRVAATLTFLLAGVALAAAFLNWTPSVAAYGVPGFPGGVAAGVALVASFVRRHGRVDRRAALVALAGFLGVTVSGAAALVFPALGPGGADTAGVGIYVALVTGVLGMAAAYGDWVGLGRSAVLARLRAGALAALLGVGGLVFGYVVVFAVVGLLAPVLPASWQLAVVTTVFSVGLGVVAAAYASQRDEGFAYFDVRVPDRRGWLYVGGGLVGMFVVLVVGGLASQALGLPTAKHGLMQRAQDTPSILLTMIPLALLAIGPSEELLNRNVVQKLLYDDYSRAASVLGATIVFTVVHVPAYGAGATPAALFVTLVRLFLVSLVLGAVYERTKNVVVAALVHGGFDAIQFGVAYVLITQGV